MLKEHYSQYTSKYLRERKALGAELSYEAHIAIDSILLERGEDEPEIADKSPLDKTFSDTSLQLVREWLVRVYRLLFRPPPPMWRYCLIAVPLALLPSMTFLSIAMFVFHLVGVPLRLPTYPATNPVWVFVTVILAPLAETAVLACLLWVLARFLRAPCQLAAASAVLWGLLHATTAPICFFGTAWSFFVFSSGYIAWRQHSRRHAFAAAAVPHGLMNLAGIAMMRAASS